MSDRTFIIYTADAGAHSVEAPSLRTALRNFKTKDASEGRRVVAAVEAGCLPVARAEGRPFLAVMLKNPNFVAPEDGQ